MRIGLQEYLELLFFGYAVRKFEDKRRTNGVIYGKVLKPLREVQRGTPYAEWIGYLKSKRLYIEYLKDVWFNIRHNVGSGFDPTDMIIQCCTKKQLEDVLKYIDEWWEKRHVPRKRIWLELYKEYQSDKDLEKRKSLLARKLYHMDAPQVKHFKYLGSSPLKVNIWDKLIDKIFLIKHV